MNNLENTTKTYCKICKRFIGYMQKDRRTLLAPVTICYNCEQLQEKERAEYNRIGKNLINTVSASALTIACIIAGIWIVYHIF